MVYRILITASASSSVMEIGFAVLVCKLVQPIVRKTGGKQLFRRNIRRIFPLGDRPARRWSEDRSRSAKNRFLEVSLEEVKTISPEGSNPTWNSPSTFSPWRFKMRTKQKQHPVPLVGRFIIAVVLDHDVIGKFVVSQHIPIAVIDIAPGPRKAYGPLRPGHIGFLVLALRLRSED